MSAKAMKLKLGSKGSIPVGGRNPAADTAIIVSQGCRQQEAESEARVRDQAEALQVLQYGMLGP